MTEIRLTRDLIADGYAHPEIRRLQRSGDLRRVRRGAYATAGPVTDQVPAIHRALVEATLPFVSPEAVLSHMSAAVLHGLPLWPDQLTRVHVTRARDGGGRVGRSLHVHVAPLAAEDVCVIDGRRVTTLARTVVDLARSLPMVRSVPIGDAALTMGTSPAELAEFLGRAAGRPGVGAARRAVAFLDPRSESVGESSSRVVLHECGLAKPELQYPVSVGDRTVARTDFCWPALRTVGEFDGEIKYGRLLKPGQSPGDVMMAEKAREDRLRDLGWEVVRWLWSDLWHPQAWHARLGRAFERGRRPR